MTALPKIPTSIPFVKSAKDSCPFIIATSKQCDKLPKADLKDLNAHGFTGKPGDVGIIRDKKGTVEKIYACIAQDVDAYALSHIPSELAKHLDDKTIGALKLTPELKGFKDDVMERMALSWALSQYVFDTYKKRTAPTCPKLVVSDAKTHEKAKTLYESAYLLRDMVNIPANDMTPEAVEKTIAQTIKGFGAKMTVTKGKKLEKDFPLVHMVGKAADVPPRFIEVTWGKKSHPKVTLVGKGVTFDSGGLNIKPGGSMALMKKDMAGSAHALAVAYIVMALKLPVSLQLLIPTVENAISGNAFRPSDIVKSRKGLTVENTNTDAEGRLILADALAFACERKPELVMDFATLTGSARAALGQSIPAFFATDDEEAKSLQDYSFQVGDPVWQMPLYAPYKALIESPNADIHNSVGRPGDLIYSALFLQSFIDDETPWMHFDMFAWEQSGKPGRPAGGSETGLFTIAGYLLNRYGK